MMKYSLKLNKYSDHVCVWNPLKRENVPLITKDEFKKYLL